MRSKPYTDAGLAAKAELQWCVQACAANRRKFWAPLCVPCDVALNALVLRYVGHPQAAALVVSYRESLERRAA